MNHQRAIIGGLSMLAVVAIAANAQAGDKKKVTVGGLEIEVTEDDSDSVEVAVSTGKVRGDQLVIAENGQRVEHTCAPGAPLIVSVLGNSNQVSLKGECKRVSVAGNANKVIIEAAGEIMASGNELTILYRRGLDGRPPKITKLGVNVAVSKVEK